MKKLLVLLTLLISPLIYSQTEYKVYIPLKTYHFDRTPKYEYIKGEGGNLGAIFIYRKNTNNNWFRDISSGVIRNSYGNLSILGTLGIGKKIGKFEASLNIGLISGYKNLFEDKIIPFKKEFTLDGEFHVYEGTNKIKNTNIYKNKLPDWMVKGGIIPAASLTLNYRTGLVSPLIVISPEYINVGILINITKK